jgi:hypothetical protein
MWKDPIVEEVRSIRDAYAKRFDYDLNRIYDDLKAQELKSGLEFVSLSPKRIKRGRQKNSTTRTDPG